MTGLLYREFISGSKAFHTDISSFMFGRMGGMDLMTGAFLGLVLNSLH